MGRDCAGGELDPGDAVLNEVSLQRGLEADQVQGFRVGDPELAGEGMQGGIEQVGAYSSEPTDHVIAADGDFRDIVIEDGVVDA